MQCAATPSKGSLMTYAIRLPLLAVFLMAALLTGLALTATPAAADRCNPGQTFPSEEDSPLCPIVDYDPGLPPSCGDNPCDPTTLNGPHEPVLEAVGRILDMLP